MFETYTPEKFCREFVQLKGHSTQLTMFMATVKGIKPAMDDWVSIDKYDEYLRICKRYGLIVKPDTIFNIVEGKDIPEGVVGKGNLTTTKAFGFPFNGVHKEGSVHLFISKSRDRKSVV
jgi:hypothetical protein